MTRTLERLEFRAMGTACSAAVTTDARARPAARRALAAAQAEVVACERALSRFDPESDLSRLNAADGRWTAVDRRLVESLRLALRAREATGGIFDPTILPALVAAGYDRTFTELAPRPPRRPEGWHAGAEIEVDEENGRARLERGAAVDLGGIGKGYGAGRALLAIRRSRPDGEGALVDLGGDLALFGEPPERGPWRIAVADPHEPGRTTATLHLHGGGVATSGRNLRRFGPGGRLHHLIDPSTGEPARPGPLAVTVVAPEPAEAEAHATALAMLPPQAAAAHVAAHAHLSAIYVPREGRVLHLGSPPVAALRFLVKAA